MPLKEKLFVKLLGDDYIKNLYAKNVELENKVDKLEGNIIKLFHAPTHSYTMTFNVDDYFNSIRNKWKQCDKYWDEIKSLKEINENLISENERLKVESSVINIIPTICPDCGRYLIEDGNNETNRC